jgi:hypothetical protein
MTMKSITQSYWLNHYKVEADPRSEEIKYQEQLEKLEKAMSLTGQALIALVISLSLLVIGFQIGRWFNFF